MSWIPNIWFSSRKRPTVVAAKKPSQVHLEYPQGAFFKLPKKTSDGNDGTIEVQVFMSAGGFLEIHIDGYGECGVDDDCGSTLMLEHYEGELRLVVTDDINAKEPTVVNLDGAAESLRPSEENTDS